MNAQEVVELGLELQKAVDEADRESKSLEQIRLDMNEKRQRVEDLWAVANKKRSELLLAVTGREDL